MSQFLKSTFVTFAYNKNDSDITSRLSVTGLFTYLLFVKKEKAALNRSRRRKKTSKIFFATHYLLTIKQRASGKWEVQLH